MATSGDKRRYGLSKSRLLSSLQCQKRLWLEVHRPDLAVSSASTQQLLNLGQDVGRAAQSLHKRGILIGSQDNLSKALVETSTHIKAGKSDLFEPTFQHNGVLVRADILKKLKNGYQIREVKASSSVKEYHLPDTAIQAWVIRGAGLKVDSVVVQHIDTSFVYPGEGDYRGLFAEQGVDDDIRPLAKEVPKWVAQAQSTLANAEPNIKTGKHCHAPYDCPFLDYCSSKEQQTEYPLTVLPNSGRTLPKLIEEGYRDVRDIPPGRLDSENQERVRRVTKAGKAELSPEAKKVMHGLAYPRYHLDFETIGLAVPIWAGTRPYQQIPFQWSCHIEHSPGKIEHRGHLDTTGSAPMQGVSESLVNTLRDDGPIFSHNAGFEKARIEDLANLVPKRARELRKLAPRFVDTLSLARAYYYHPAMMGSWSLKAVLPTIAPELDYANVGEVQEGGQASAAYFEIISSDTTSERKAQLRVALEKYCERDSLATVRITRFFETGK